MKRRNIYVEGDDGRLLKVRPGDTVTLGCSLDITPERKYARLKMRGDLAVEYIWDGTVLRQKAE